MDLELDLWRGEIQGERAGVILLDTNALIWMGAGHPRSRSLTQRREALYVSPASLLELQFLNESGKVRLRNHNLVVACATMQTTEQCVYAARDLGR